MLDLGCGLGACGFAAARRGARVTFFDWEPRAIEIVAASAERQPIPPSRSSTSLGDWRQPPPLGPFDLILGADVLYEQRNAPAVATFLASHLAPGGSLGSPILGRRRPDRSRSRLGCEGLVAVGQETLPRAGAAARRSPCYDYGGQIECHVRRCQFSGALTV